MSRDGGQLAISELQHLSCPFRLLAPSAYFHEDTRDIPDHMLQKGIRLDIQNDETMVTSHLQAHDFPEWSPGLATCSTERSEVVLAKQVLPSLVHTVYIKSQTCVSQLTGEDGRFDHAVVNHVLIAPGKGREASMKVVIDGARPAHPHRRWQHTIGATQPCLLATIYLAIKVHNLPCRMHTGIGSARANQIHRMSSNPGQSILEGRLYGRHDRITLSLPTMERGAVIFDAECDPGQGKTDVIQERNSDFRKQTLRILDLLFVTLVHHFVEDFPGAVIVAHFVVRASQVQLGGRLI